MRDPGILVRYPPCPNWDAAWLALSRCCDSVQKEMRSRGEEPAELRAREFEQIPSYLFYWDMRAGRKCPGWFSEAGLNNLSIRIKGDMVQFQGSEGMERGTIDLLPADEGQEGERHQKRFDLEHERLVAAGLLDQATLERASDEARRWYEDPRAFHYWVLVFVAGQAWG